MELQEVEVARITIASTTQDVTCVYARSRGRSIELRVVDEYDGDTLSGLRTQRARLPLSLGMFTRFFLGAWDLRAVIQMNFEDDGYPNESVFEFFSGSSSFYPDFDDLLRKRVRTFVRQRKAALNRQLRKPNI